MLCLIGFDNNKVIKDFIRIHVEGLREPKCCLEGTYPNYQWRGLNVRKLHEQSTWRRRLSLLIPYFLTSRRLTELSNSPESVQRALGRFLSAQGVSVLLVEFGDAGAALAPVAERFQIPLVVHFHGHDAHRKTLLTAELRQQYGFMFRTAAAVLVVSRYMWQTLLDMGCPAEKLIYNPYGPRDRFFDVQPDYRPLVLSVGRFTDIKANYLVLMAFAQALREVRHARLLMVGSGELLEACRTLADVWGVGHAVEFRGPVEHSRVHDLFAQACCFAQHSLTPSYGDAEGTPNTILEASAAALPVVSTYHAGIPDVVISGETGLLVEERDVQGMAEHLIRLLKDPECCRSLGQRARDRVRRHFSSAAHLGRLQQALDFARAGHRVEIAQMAEESLKIGSTP